MSTVVEVYDRIGKAIEGERMPDIMAAMSAAFAEVLVDGLIPGSSVDDALVILNRQIKDHVARIEKEKRH